jgi:flagellar motor switch protein FliM
MPPVIAIDAARLGDQSLALERVPQLGAALERSAALLAEALRAYFPSEPAVALTRIDKRPLAEALAESCDMTSARFHAEAWDGHLLVGVERASLDLFIGAMLGGADPGSGAERAPTEFDLRAARCVFEAVSGALRDAFASVAASEFVFQRLKARTDDSLLPSSAGMAFVAIYEIRIANARARIVLILPHDALTNVRRKLANASAFQIEDPQWLGDLRQRVGAANVVVKAVAVERILTLQDIAHWRVGSLIDLPGDALNRIALVAEGTRLGVAQLGQADGLYTLRIGAAGIETLDKEGQSAHGDECAI